MKTKLWILLLNLFLILGGANELIAQVTIGANVPPHKDALLDLKEKSDGTSDKGLLMPRVGLTATNLASPLEDHVAGMTIYNTEVSPEGTDAKYYVSPGFYYNTGTKWERLYLGSSNWFYMPSVSFNTSADATNVKVNLYNLYKAQFSAPIKASTGAPAIIPYRPAADQLYYYITDVDTSVFTINSISATGEMDYDVKAAATDCSYINIVFVLK